MLTYGFKANVVCGPLEHLQLVGRKATLGD
jgi:hypothetical protein